LLHANKIKYVKVQNGDTFYKISKEFGMSLWQLYKYNNMDDKSYISVGDILFLQPKKSKGSKKQHVVAHGETLQQISQTYGIKYKSLLKKNGLTTSSKITKGQKLKLK